MMKRFVLAWMLLMSFFSGGCLSQASTVDTRKPLIIVSIPPYISLVQAIAGNTVSVETAVPPNFDPHTMEVTPLQRQLLQGGSLFVAIGETYEKQLLQTLRAEKQDLRVLHLNTKVPLLPYAHETHCSDACHSHHSHPHSSKDAQDIHFWLSPKRLEPQVQALAQALITLNPHLEETYNKNAADYIEKIQQVDSNIETLLQPYRGKGILVSHAALGYFCHDYNLIQISVEYEGKSPLPQDLNHILKQTLHTDVVCAFTAPQFNNKGVEMLAKKLHLRTCTFNPLSENILKTLEQIATDITN